MNATMKDVAMSVALHHDTDLAASSRPLEVLVESLFVGAAGDLRHWYTPVEGRKSPPPAPFHLGRLMKLVADGVAAAAAETAPETPDADRMLVLADTMLRMSQTRCKYDAVAVFGSARLREIGAQRALDAAVAFADAVGVRAGVVHWASSAAYAAGLATCGGSTSLSREEVGHITDLMYWQPRWGEVIRGPAWGTFLGAAHVDRLGGFARLEREAACTRAISLSSGGAFLQVTPLDAPLVEDHDDGGALARLAEVLATVMGRR